jgi:hypothetical protein
MGWKKVAHGGTDYHIYQQHDLNNCGPSSIAILLKQALGLNVAIGLIQMACGQTEAADAYDPGRSADARWYDWGVGGATIGWTLLHTLQRKWKALKANEDHDEMSDTIVANVSAQKPAICRVEWTNGDGHFIVCVGQVGTDLVFLDPYFGLVTVPAGTGSNVVQYSTLGGSFSQSAATGQITYVIYTDP